jgi:hypothetical protein
VVEASRRADNCCRKGWGTRSCQTPSQETTDSREGLDFEVKQIPFGTNPYVAKDRRDTCNRPPAADLLALWPLRRRWRTPHQQVAGVAGHRASAALPLTPHLARVVWGGQLANGRIACPEQGRDERSSTSGRCVLLSGPYRRGPWSPSTDPVDLVDATHRGSSMRTGWLSAPWSNEGRTERPQRASFSLP